MGIMGTIFKEYPLGPGYPIANYFCHHRRDRIIPSGGNQGWDIDFSKATSNIPIAKIKFCNLHIFKGLLQVIGQWIQSPNMLLIEDLSRFLVCRIIRCALSLMQGEDFLHIQWQLAL